jgi:hypothetical protein
MIDFRCPDGVAILTALQETNTPRMWQDQHFFCRVVSTFNHLASFASSSLCDLHWPGSQCYKSFFWCFDHAALCGFLWNPPLANDAIFGLLTTQPFLFTILLPHPWWGEALSNICCAYVVQLKGTSAHLHALKFQLNEARFQAYAPTNGKGKSFYQLNEPVCGSR